MKIDLQTVVNETTVNDMQRFSTFNRQFGLSIGGS